MLKKLYLIVFVVVGQIYFPNQFVCYLLTIYLLVAFELNPALISTTSFQIEQNLTKAK